MVPDGDGDAAPSSDRIVEGWPGRSDAYDAWLASPFRRVAAAVVRELELAPGARFLDVATGTGALALAAARVGADVLAADATPSLVSAARGNLGASGLPGRVEVMDGQALALPDEAFDAAGSLLGLTYFPSIAAGARELRRVLRPGGRAAVVAWAPDGFTAQRLALEALGEVAPERTDLLTLPAAFRISARDLAALLTDAGFAAVEVRTLSGAWRIHEPESLFHSIPSWSAPFRPIFQRLALDIGRLQDAAALFAALVRRHSTAEGLPMRMLVGIGTR
jgi:SAM-dependent methyltransferase